MPETDAANPELAVTVKVVVAPCAIVCTEFGLIAPLAPALGVTAYVIWVNVALTEQLAVIGLVVNVLPSSVPPQLPVTLAA